MKFDEDGTRILDLFRILQYQNPTDDDITFQLVGFVNISGNGSFRFLNESFNNNTIWPGVCVCVGVYLRVGWNAQTRK